MSLVRKWITPDGDELGEVRRVDGGFRVNYFDFADFFVSEDGSESRILARYSESPDAIEHIYRNQIVPMALSRQGKLVMHASAIAVADQCVAFVGVSGRGKSTLAASFASIGFPFLTDDGLVVSVINGVHCGSPRHAIVNLRDASKQHFERVATVPLTLLPSGFKWSMRSGAQMPHCEHTLPLTKLYFLGEGGADDVHIEKTRQHEAIRLLLSNSFVLDTTDKAALQVHFGQISQLVANVPCFALDYPRDFAVLPLLHAALDKHMISDVIGQASASTALA